MRKKPHPRARSGTALKLVLLALGLILLLVGAKYAALLVLGDTQNATVNYAVRRYGASRGTVYTVHYSFVVRGRGAYRGDASTGASSPPAGHLTIRYLSFYPSINHPGTKGLLAFYSLLSLLPGVLLVWCTAVALRRGP
jgi:hypothetical protein